MTSLRHISFAKALRGAACLLIGLTVAAPAVQAACLDHGSPSFAASAPKVRLCIGQDCEQAQLHRSCGNVHYAAEEYETEAHIWNFRIRVNEGVETEFSVERRPANPEDVPLTIVDGRPTRLLEGKPVEQGILEQLTCAPLGAQDGCDFVERVLAGVN
ncbi:hypothetical protein [Aliiroseovarius sp.]|uniref:hypothetical protein n=1 Tax=Aliiroseovarius sp. TaxID=1872442 RepID=UPI003BAD63A0